MGVHVAEDEATIEVIANALGETEERPLTQIGALVRLLGREGAMQILAETQAIEAAGGMMLPNGARRRTPGGVFFVVARRKLSKEDQTAIFGAPPRPPQSAPASPPVTPRPVPAVQPKPPAASDRSDAHRSSVDRSGPRRRVVDVIEMRRHPSVERRPPGPFLSPPEQGAEPRFRAREGAIIEDLARSENRSRVKEQVRSALATLDVQDRHYVLIDLLADLHGRTYVATAPEPPSAPLTPPAQAQEPLMPAQPVPAKAAPAGKPRSLPVARSSRPTTAEREAPVRAVSARSKVLEMIRRRPGISTAELAERVFGDDSDNERKKVSAIVAALKTEGKIRSAGRGRFELDD
jgi:hypothetical protein